MLSNKISITKGTKKETIEYIKNLARILGYTPTKADIPQREMAVIKIHYRAWTKIIPDAGLEPFTTKNQQQLRQKALDERLKKLAQAYSQDADIMDKEEYEFLKYEYCCKTKQQPKEIEPIKNNSSKEEIKEYLKALARELGYSPTMPVTASSKQILKKYKTWMSALKGAGLEPSDSEQQYTLREEKNEEKFREILENITKQKV